MATALVDTNDKGAFVRKASIFRRRIEKGGKYPPATGRYVLYVSYACPWANRCLAYWQAKGLQDVIKLAVVSPIWRRTRPDDPSDTHEGWVFDTSVEGTTPDPIFGASTIREVYEEAMKSEGVSEVTRFTVPILADAVTRTIVNNESSEIIRFFDVEFDEWARNPTLRFAPEALVPQIDAMNERTYEPICNGVYKCGFARTQEAYDEAVTTLFAALDGIDALLSEKRYLIGPTITEADVRLFMCLVRFDEVYVVHFKCCKRAIREYINLPLYLRDVYQSLGLAPVIKMDHIKLHYYGSHRSINTYGIIPISAGTVAALSLPHGRERLS